MRAIAFITPNTDTFSNPTLFLLIGKLIEQNYRILLFSHKQIFIPDSIRDKIELHSLPFNFVNFFGRPEPQRRAADLIKLVRQYHLIYKLFRIKNNIKTLICIDPWGIVYGGRIKKLINVKLIYISFEIFFDNEIKDPDKKKIKALEKEYSKKSELIIIQDEEREKLLREENNLADSMRFIHIPVSPEKINIPTEKYDVCGKLNIPEDKTIVVYSGSLQSWSGIMNILDLFPEKWNNDNWLLIHTHNDLPEDNKVRRRINKLIKEGYNLSYHNKPFTDFSDYVLFLTGCHIGLAVYFPNYEDSFSGKNVDEIGLSSGKFSTYIMLGIPTITTSNKIFKYLNEKFNFGYVINSPEDIQEAIRNINKEYSLKAEGCLKLFNEVLDPELKLNSITEVINSYYD